MSWFNKKKDVSSDKTSLGAILVEAGQITEIDLNLGLEYQREHPDEMLGQALVRIGKLKPEVLEFVLEQQRVMRNLNRKTVSDAVRSAQMRATAAGIACESLAHYLNGLHHK